ncbi:MAG: Txe/YoeB family addiction module toxin [Bacteroidales bacterium]|nr:Txe/YoeB family addiction module toxin [Bacteroidales bacterium]
MQYKVVFTSESQQDVHKLSFKAPFAIKKLGKLIEELRDHPRTGTGKAERLKYFSQDEVWSRRITQQHRLVYCIREEIAEVWVLSVYGHYE